MNAKIFSIIFILLICAFAYGSYYDYAYILKIDSYSVYPTTVYPDDTVGITITLKNISEVSDAMNVKIEAQPNPTYFESIKSTDSIKIIKFSQTGSLSLLFRVKPFTPGGYYSIPLKITYTKKGEAHDIDTQVTIKVEHYKRGNLEVVKAPEMHQYLGDTFSIEGKIENTGNIVLKGTKVEIELDNAKILPLTEITQSLGDIEPNNSKSFSFRFKIPKGATPGIYTLKLKASDFEHTFDEETVVVVIEDKPDLIISSIDKSIVEGEVLKQGTHFSLSVQLENISKAKAKSVTIELIDSTTKIEGTTLAYVGSIDEDDSGAGVFDLYIPKDANPGTQKIYLKISYLDEYDQEYSFQKEVSIYIEQENNTKNVALTIIIILVALAIVAYLIIRQKQKKKVKDLM